MTKTKPLNNLRLHRGGLLIDGVGAKRRTNDGTGRPTAFRLSYELADCHGHVVRVRRTCSLEHLGKGLKHHAGNLAHFSVGLATAPVCRKLENSERPPYLRLANELHLYPSEVYASVKRARASHFVQGPELGDRLNRSSLLEFLIHGIRYAFPAQTGAPTRGVPTSYAAPPLSKTIADAGELPPVWPYADGKVRGYSFAPLHKNVPQAALADERLYELLALVDALRNGRARERKLASQELTRRLEMSANAKS